MANLVETDVLVIGGGGAAARAALAASGAGARTTLAVKGWFGWLGMRGAGATGCGIAPWWGFSAGRGVPGKPDEETALNIALILQAGLGMADRKLVRSMVAGQEEARRDLERYGAVVATGFKASDRRRLVQVMPGLAYHVRGSEVSIRDHMMITDLLVKDGACVGAIGIDERSGEVWLFAAKATILATGGDAQLYTYSCHPSCMTGDGYAMAYHVGARLINMEYMQSFLATVYPSINLLWGGWSWRRYPRVTNALGEAVLPKYLPAGIEPKQCLWERGGHNPFSTRDRASRYLDVAIVKEVQAGRGTPHLGCFVEGLDPENVSPEHGEWMRYRGIDLGGRLEVSSVHQCSDGGLYVSENAETTLPGLYAVGEVSAGMHGADRLGGHMMVNTQVFGKRAGLHAAKRSRGTDAPRLGDSVTGGALARLDTLRQAKGDVTPAQILGALQRSAWANMLAVRNETGLTEMLGLLRQLRAESLPRLSAETPSDLVRALELQNMVLVGEMVARAALLRTESRGGHYREDYPERDDRNWLRAIEVRRDGTEMRLETFVIDPEWQDLPGDLGDWFWG
ncbi:MAG TPA: FAD-binding protein [Candidatus Sulfotelmatobacter sp.]|nr:FAD-binding protein [Candidatus Sulfotelmatobacter sp.]